MCFPMNALQPLQMADYLEWRSRLGLAGASAPGAAQQQQVWQLACRPLAA